MNPSVENPAFLWNNLIKLDENKRRLSPEIEDIVFALFNVIPGEIEILSPDMVVFFIGPRYEKRLMKIFPNLSFERVASIPSEAIWRCLHPQLPQRSFWTYHPRYLRMSRKWWVIDALAELA